MRSQYYKFASAANIAVPGLDVEVGGIKLILCSMRGLVPGLALAITKLVVSVESIALPVTSMLVFNDMIEGCVVSVCCESILSNVEDGPVSVDAAECEGEDDASIVDKSIPTPAPAPINILVLSSVS